MALPVLCRVHDASQPEGLTRTKKTRCPASPPPTLSTSSLSPLHRSLRGERETDTCGPPVIEAGVQPCARIARSRRTSHREDDGESNNNGKKTVGAVARLPTCQASTPSRPVQKAMRDRHVGKGLNGVPDFLFNGMSRDTAHGGREAGPDREAGPAWGLGGVAPASLDLYGLLPVWLTPAYANSACRSNSIGLR